MADESAGKLQLPVTVDSTGARQGFQEVSDAGRRMADEVAASGRKASDGLKPLETAPSQAAAAVSRAERVNADGDGGRNWAGARLWRNHAA